MKKKLLISLSALFLVACQQPVATPDQDQASAVDSTVVESSQSKATDSQSQKTADEDRELRDYYPLIKNYEAQFKGDGIEFSSLRRVYDFIEGDFVQSRTNNSGTSVMEVIRVSDEAVDLIVSQPEFYVRENYIDRVKDQEPLATLLKAPLEVGTKWENPEDSREITAVDVDIPLENGETVSAIEVTITLPSGQNREYYAPGYGLVREESLVNDDTVPAVTSTLESLETDGWTEDVRVTQPNAQATGFEEVTVAVPIETNTLMREAFRQILSGETGLLALLPAGTKIQALHTNQMDPSIVYTDFSPEIEQIAGSAAIQYTYYPIFKTLTDYYASSLISATVNGQPLQVDQLGPLPQPYQVQP